MKSKYQKFTVKTVHRSKLMGADYNPRTISESASKKLKKSIKENGLVETLVWNERTGNLVGGHQRIGQLDELHGTNDYELDVAVIDVDEKQEAKLNVVLNNQSAMGEFNFDMLDDISKTFDVSFKDMLFDQEDVNIMSQSIQVSSKTMDELSGTYEEIKKDRARIHKSMKERDASENGLATSDDYCLTVVFKKEKDKKKFCKRCRISESEKAIRSSQLLRSICERLLDYLEEDNA